MVMSLGNKIMGQLRSCDAAAFALFVIVGAVLRDGENTDDDWDTKEVCLGHCRHQ